MTRLRRLPEPPPPPPPSPDDEHVEMVERYRDDLIAYAVGLNDWHALCATKRAIPTGDGWTGRAAVSEVQEALDALGDAFWRAEGNAADIAAELDQAIVVARLAACADCEHEIMPGALADHAVAIEESPLRRIAGAAALCHDYLQRIAAGEMTGAEAEIAAGRSYHAATLEIADLLPALHAAEDMLASTLSALLGANYREI